MQKNKKSQKCVFSCHQLLKKFDELEIFKNISFSINNGEKIGLVGPNGSGKSTLLKIIAGLLEKDDGNISCSSDTVIKYFPQVHLGQNEQSGGEKAREILISTISDNADLFLLDEPTNNLDLDGLTILENFITKSNKAFLIVSHDRAFLDRTVSKIVEIDPITKLSYIYDGNYSNYRIEKEMKIERQWKEYSDKSETMQKLGDLVDTKLSFVDKIEKKRRNTKNLPIHEKNKPQASILRDKEGRAGRRARIIKDQLNSYKESSEEIIKPKRLLPLKINFDNEQGGIKVFDLKNVYKKMGERNIGPINLRVQYGDRIHIVGKNGVGKTTLLKILVGEIKADSGIVEKGENVKIGYLSQEGWDKKSHKTVIQEFLDYTKLNETDARKILNRFRITEEDVTKDVSLLSPGEYSRLIVAELVAIKPNCIILDEPSNHLDLEVLEELENGLEKYKGTLILVSHDRYFIERIKPTSIFDVGVNSARNR